MAAANHTLRRSTDHGGRSSQTARSGWHPDGNSSPTRSGRAVRRRVDRDAGLAQSKQLRLVGDVYLSIDLDALDPAFAPGVSHHEPGGLTTRELLAIVQSIDSFIVGADVVEFNPARDINGITAMTAAKIVKEVLAAMLPAA